MPWNYLSIPCYTIEVSESISNFVSHLTRNSNLFTSLWVHATHGPWSLWVPEHWEYVHHLYSYWLDILSASPWRRKLVPDESLLSFDGFWRWKLWFRNTCLTKYVHDYLAMLGLKLNHEGLSRVIPVRLLLYQWKRSEGLCGGMVYIVVGLK